MLKLNVLTHNTSGSDVIFSFISISNIIVLITMECNKIFRSPFPFILVSVYKLRQLFLYLSGIFLMHKSGPVSFEARSTGERQGGKWKWICRNAVMVQVLALTATETLPVLNTREHINCEKWLY